MAHIGITKTALPDGRFTLSGRTFDYKEQIKAAGGKWDPALKTWTLEAAAEQQLMFLVPPLSVAAMSAPAAAMRLRRSRVPTAPSAIIARATATRTTTTRVTKGQKTSVFHLDLGWLADVLSLLSSLRSLSLRLESALLQGWQESLYLALEQARRRALLPLPFSRVMLHMLQLAVLQFLLLKMLPLPISDLMLLAIVL
jgi:hypothetical protein